MLRAITLTQPWAGLVMAGIKLVENRPRPIIKNSDIVAAAESGTPMRVAIHASRVYDRAAYEWICETERDLAPEHADTKEKSLWHQLARIKSALLGTIDVTGALYIGGCSPAAIAAALNRVDMLSQLRFTFGPTVYTLAKPRLCETPVPCKGMLGHWLVPPSKVAQMGAAA